MSPFFFLVFSSFCQSFQSEYAEKQGRTHMKRGGAEWGLCNPLAVVAERIRACCTWLMEQLFLHQVVKTHQWRVYKKLILNLAHHTCGSMDLREESWFFFTLFHGFWHCRKQFHPLFGQKHFRRLPESALIYLPSWRTAQRISLQPRGAWVLNALDTFCLHPSGTRRAGEWHWSYALPSLSWEIPYKESVCCFPLAQGHCHSHNVEREICMCRWKSRKKGGWHLGKAWGSCVEAQRHRRNQLPRKGTAWRGVSKYSPVI